MTHPLASTPKAAQYAPLLVIEDDPRMQARLRSVLASLGYAEAAMLFAASYARADALLLSHPCAMVLLGMETAGGSGVELIQRLRTLDAALPILAISAESSEQAMASALRAGATGYLLKERDDVEIALSIRSALRGGAPIDPFVAKGLLDMLTLRDSPAAAAPRTPAATLSAREVEILRLVDKGFSNQEIAGSLFLSRLTVESHTRNIYKKLAVNSRTQAVFEARSHGMLA